MKSLIFLTLGLASVLSSQAQGTMSYYNRGVVNAQTGNAENIPIFLLPEIYPGVGAGPGRAGAGVFSVGLFLKTGNSYSLITTAQDPLVNPIGSFRTTATPNDLTTYMVESITLIVPTVAPGQSATFQFRVWVTADGSYDNSGIRGSSADLFVAQLGGSTEGGTIQTPNLGNTGFSSFTMGTVPEPSTYALGVAGLGILAFLRRRK